MDFEIVGEIRSIELIASGRGIRIFGRLNRQFGVGNWRKLEGVATVRLASGELVEAEGKRRMKVKRFLS